MSHYKDILHEFGDDAEYLSTVIIVNAGGTINMRRKRDATPAKGGSIDRRHRRRIDAALFDNEAHPRAQMPAAESPSTNEALRPGDGISSLVTDLAGALEDLEISVTVESPFGRPPDSSNIGDIEWNILLSTVRTIVKRKMEIDRKLRDRGIALRKGGVVIAHGTDTLQHTSLVFALAFACDLLDVPIIFTGSHSAPDDVPTDAKQNLLKAIVSAREHFTSANETLKPGVYVVIGRDIHLASRITKVRTSPDPDGKYFFSFPAPVGQIGGIKSGFEIRFNPTFHAQLLKEHPSLAVCRVAVRPWGIVEHLFIDMQTEIQVLKEYKLRTRYYRSTPQYESRRQGIVLQGDFSKHPDFREFSDYVTQLSNEDQDLVVLVGSRHVYDAILRGHPRARVTLIHRSMSHAAARLKLSWLLQFDIPVSDVAEFINTNIAGEIFDADELPEWIDYETFPPGFSHNATLIIYPGILDRVVDDTVKRLMKQQGARSLFVFGFGDGHIPCHNESLYESVNKFLTTVRLFAHHELKPAESEADLDWLLSAVNDIISGVDKQRLTDYLLQNYTVRQKELEAIVRGHIGKTIVDDYLEMAEGTFMPALTRVPIVVRGHQVSIERLRKAVRDVAASEFKVSKEDINQKVAAFIGRKSFDMLDNGSCVALIAKHFIQLVGMRIIKEAIMRRTPVLRCLGQAVDHDICVSVKTNAVRSRTNSRRYETGQVLMALGIDSDECAGWRSSVLIPAIAGL